MRQLEIGEIIDGFVIEKQLYEGGSATLYKAKDSYDADTPVVLKIPKDNIFNQPELFYHFQNEEFISRYLNHPGIIRFLARQRSSLYIVQEFVEGQDLKSFLQKENKLPEHQAVEFCLQLAKILHYLHQRSIVHLDLKPENIMVQPDNTVKLIDFGLANHLGMRDHLGSDFNSPQGTPYYIAPEQLCGIRNMVQSDIYSLGIVFFEMLTAKLPFERSDKLSVVKLRLTREPIPPRYFNHTVHPVLQQIILTMLRRDPKTRYKSAEDIINDLEHYQTMEVGPLGQLTEKSSALIDFVAPDNCKLYKDQGYRQEDIAIPLKTRNILGCIIDDDNSRLVIEEIRREVLQTGGVVTLLTVLEEEIEGDEIDYANSIAGKSFSKRIDTFLTVLKNHDIQVTLRIKRGKPVKAIKEMAESIDADLIILGPPRIDSALQNFMHFIGGTTLARLAGSMKRNLRIITPASAGPGPKIRKEGIVTKTRDYNLRLFLADIWSFHLNCLIWAIGAEQGNKVPPEKFCPSGRWLTKLVNHGVPEELANQVLKTHHELHVVLDSIVEKRKNNEDFRELYHRQGLKLTQRLKKELEKIEQIFIEAVTK